MSIFGRQFFPMDLRGLTLTVPKPKMRKPRKTIRMEFIEKSFLIIKRITNIIILKFGLGKPFRLVQLGPTSHLGSSLN